MSSPGPKRVRRTGRAVDAALWAVAGLVGAFSFANVHGVAVAHGTSDPEAWLLAPIVDIALLTGITADATLSRYGARSGAWGAVLRWFCGAATWLLNIWDAVTSGDIGAVVTHSVPPIVLILLAEAAPRYRQRFAALLAGDVASSVADDHAPRLDETGPRVDAATAETTVVSSTPVRALTSESATPQVNETPCAPSTPRPRAKHPAKAPQRGSGRHEVAKAYATIPADDTRSQRQLAADIASTVGLAESTVRQYLAEANGGTR